MLKSDRKYNTESINVRVRYDTHDRLLKERQGLDTMDTVIRRLLDFMDAVKEDRGH